MFQLLYLQLFTGHVHLDISLMETQYIQIKIQHLSVWLLHVQNIFLPFTNLKHFKLEEIFKGSFYNWENWGPRMLNFSSSFPINFSKILLSLHSFLLRKKKVQWFPFCLTLKMLTDGAVRAFVLLQ